MLQKFNNTSEKIYKLFSNSIGIDLGTANTLVYVHNYGIIVNEPSVVAVNQKTGQVVAVGTQAKQMLGRTPSHISAVRPLVDGVVSNFEIAEEMLTYFLRKVHNLSPKFIRPTVVVGVPSGITNVETRAVRDAAKSAGARQVYIVEEPMAAALGIELPIKDPVGSMVVDVGGGNTDIAVISLSGIVQSKNLRIAGDRFNEDIVSYIRNEFKILIGERTAESIKIAIGSVVETDELVEAPVRGRDLVTGLPREVIITDADIREAISNSIMMLINSVKEVLETTPPEVLSDVMLRGIVLVGGGATIPGLANLLEEALHIPIHIAHDPMTAVVRGAGVILENIDAHRDILIDSDDELPAIE
ncbi:rod shape-determining protein [bacterium]|nr:rod shape-determining protein [bacterium]|tara:strand:- start:5939 stop:7012 length:1074 start_codon:yes stop_codon:yes gene_type:complete